MIEVERLPIRVKTKKEQVVTELFSIVGNQMRGSLETPKMPATVASKLPTYDEFILDLLDPNVLWFP
jgi:hypothetical protein